MVKRRLFGAIIGMAGAFIVYSEIVSYHHPHSSGILLARSVSIFLMGALSLLIGLQRFWGAGGETRTWRAVGYVVIAYGTLDLFIEKRQEFWVFLAFAGVLSVTLISFFAIAHVKGYRGRRADAKTLPPAKEGNEGV